MLRFEIHKELNKKCERAWKELEKKSSCNYFQTLNYNRELIQKNKTEKVNIVIIYNKKLAIALFPLEVKKYFFFRVLQWIGTKKSDYCNPIIDSNFEKHVSKNIFINLWREIFTSLDKFDLFFFNNQLSKIGNVDNPFTKYFKTTIFSKIFQIRLTSTFEDYKKDIKKKDKNHFYEIHRTLIKLNNLKKIHEVKFVIDDLMNSKLKLEDIIKNKIKQLENKKEKYNLDKNFIEIYNNLNKFNNKNFLIAKLKVDKKIVSACFGIFFKDVFYYYIPIILSNNYNNYKIGKILILQIINWCILKKVKVFDFGLGDEKYKKYFSNYSISLHRYYYYKNLKGYFLFVLLKMIFFLKSRKLKLSFFRLSF